MQKRQLTVVEQVDITPQITEELTDEVSDQKYVPLRPNMQVISKQLPVGNEMMRSKMSGSSQMSEVS
tara:strand:+ start:265 stop:465 length:201 start_codon:yes stop_codon:yes gene_type:complete